MPRQIIDFTPGWEFQLSDHLPQSPLWRSVSIPHDWSVEHPFDEALDGATGYLPGGMGWYRKRFSAPPLKPNQRVIIVFDGIYNNSELRLNGQLLARHPYGYSPLKIDITDHLDSSNELIVKVDRRRYIDSRWYTGSGIYRAVNMFIVNPTHIDIWGNQLTADRISRESATITQSLSVNLPRYLESATQQTLQIKTSLIDCQIDMDKPVACHVHTASELDFDCIKRSQPFSFEFSLQNPKLWSFDTPNRYQVVTQLITTDENGQQICVDKDTQPFGIRTIRFDPDNGFFLNEQATKIKGVCLHHDGGIVGAAVPDAVWRRRLLKLKQAGVNAIRSAHNPASLAFLKLCDELGLLVQDEFFDEWDYPKDKRLNMGEQHEDFSSRGYTQHFHQYAESDLKNTLRSRVNHPCIFMWSIGNEIEWTYPRNVAATGFFDASWDGNYFWNLPPHSPEQISQHLEELPRQQHDIGNTAKMLSGWVKQLDTSRPVTANCILPSASYLSGYADALDVIGFSYRRVVYDYGHQHYPNLPIIGNENLGQWHEWKAAIERPHVAGIFLWTGINYMGESHGQWPTRTTDSGLLDAAGFEKPSHAMFKSLWCYEPVLNMFTQSADNTDLVIAPEDNAAYEADPVAWQQKLWTWPQRNQHWNYDEQQMVVVEVYTNCPAVELQLNGQSMGKRVLSEHPDHILRWSLPFSPGTLTAIECDLEDIKSDKRRACSCSLTSADSAIAVELDVEFSDQDGAYRHIILKNIDSQQRVVRHQQVTYRIEIEGGRLLGVDNGAKDSLQPYQSNTITTHNGQALALVVLEKQSATISVTGVLSHSENSGVIERTIQLS
jgi:hypothetical protein